MLKSKLLKKSIIYFSIVTVGLFSYKEWAEYYGGKIVRELYPVNYFINNKSEYERTVVPDCNTGGASVEKVTLVFTDSNNIQLTMKKYKANYWINFPANYLIDFPELVETKKFVVNDSLYHFSGDSLIFSRSLELYDN